MLSSILAAWYTGVFKWYQIPLLIALVGLIIFYVQWKKKQM
ncbi:MAG: hypothetical protein NT031_20445 [Planctomycetota bacterium]|nr:hypothetical protein [Planctomycetota bacterium]